MMRYLLKGFVPLTDGAGCGSNRTQGRHRPA